MNPAWYGRVDGFGGSCEPCLCGARLGEDTAGDRPLSSYRSACRLSCPVRVRPPGAARRQMALIRLQPPVSVLLCPVLSCPVLFCSVLSVLSHSVLKIVLFRLASALPSRPPLSVRQRRIRPTLSRPPLSDTNTNRKHGTVAYDGYCPLRR